MGLIEARQRGDAVVTTAEAPDHAELVDLVAKIEQSMAAARRRPGNTLQAEPLDRGGDDLASASTPELYETAQDLAVPGRSSMTKDELVDAVRAARTRARRAS